MNGNVALLKAEPNVSWKGFMLFSILLLVTSNQLLPFPIDKVATLALFVFVIYNEYQSFYLKRYEFEVLIILLLIILSSYFVNFFDAPGAIIFFPLIGCLLCFILARREKLTTLLYYALFFHFILAFIFYILSYAIGFIKFTEDLTYKGLPFIHVIKGFTPTIQVFGSFCLSWLLLYYDRKDRSLLGRGDKSLFYFVNFCLLLTFNRTSFIGYMLILAFRERKVFYTLLVISLSIFVTFFDFLSKTFFSLSTLDARSELLEGFNKSFWNSYSIPVYIFGRGNNQIGNSILQTVKWDFRKDIENGYAMILHTYGFFGLVFYVVVSILVLHYLLKRKSVFLFMMALFFLFVQPYFTQEFMATSFYISLSVIIFIARQSLSAVPLANG